MTIGLSRRNLLQIALASAATLATPAIIHAANTDPITIGYFIPAWSQIQSPGRLSWVAAANIVAMCLEPLARSGGENKLDYVLAEQISGDATGKIWTIHLNPNARWQNGKPVTAGQVAANFQHWLDDKESSLGAQLRDFVEEIQIESSNGERVLVKLKTPNYRFLFILTSYAALIMHPDDEWTFSAQSLGTGPFSMVSYEPMKEARFRPVDSYWNPANRAKYPVTFVRDNQASDASFDFIPQLDPNRGPVLKAKGISIKQNNLGAALVFHMDCRTGDLANPLVRQALRACMDPKAMLDSIFGYGHVSDHTHASPIHLDYPADWSKKTIYDPDQARKLLEKKRLVIPLHYPADNIWQKNAVQAFQAQADKVGIQIVPTPHGQAEFEVNWNKYPGITSVKWNHRPLALQLYREVYYSTAKWNLSGWKNAEFDHLVDRLISTPMDNKVIVDRYTRRAMQILQEDGPMIQVIWLDCNKAYNSRRLVAASVIVGSGGLIYANKFEKT